LNAGAAQFDHVIQDGQPVGTIKIERVDFLIEKHDVTQAVTIGPRLIYESRVSRLADRLGWLALGIRQELHQLGG